MTVQNLELRNNTSMNNDPLIMAYRYDQLNRIKKSEFFTWDGVPSTEEYDPTSNQYSTDYSYDPNGNLVNLNRFSDFEQIDAFQYQYTTAGTNQLSNLSDAISGTGGNDFEGNSTYTYDPIGNLISDSGDGISEIKWTVGGKVKEVVHTANGTEDVEFKYDALGNRVVKIAKGRSSGTTPQSAWIYTYYVRDAQGNILATYNRNFRLITQASTDVYRDQFSIQEFNIFGSSRVGVRTDTKMLEYSENEVSGFLQNGEFNYLTKGFPVYLQFDEEQKRSLGDKQFELTNHLGNVLATISDRKVGITDAAYSPAIKFDPAIISAQDYYPFGMIMPKRFLFSDNYRYGFGNHEKIDEVYRFGNVVDMGDRWLDTRLGRTLKLDRKANKYPNLSPYSYAANNPIVFIDPDGKEIVIAHLSGTQQDQYKAQIVQLRAENVYFDVLYSMLESSDVKYYITEGQRTQVTGSFVPGVNDKGEKITTGGSIDFRTFDFDGSTGIEEFFHAFQNETYVDKGSYDKLKDVGGNVEFEAKFLKLMVDINQGNAIVKFPDIEGFTEIAIDLIEKYDLTEEQKQKYFDAVNTFIDYHKQQKDKIEQETGKRPKDLYDAPATGQTPDAAFKVLEAGDKKKAEDEKK